MNHAHRNQFEPSVRAALGLLDRVAEGQNVPERDVQLALEVTGDVQSAFPRFRELPRENSARPAAGPWRGWHEGPSNERERHPHAGGRP